MSRVQIYRVPVEFGDCDPAGIVWYPNFVGWMDAASRHFFVSCGVPLWRDLARSRGLIGTPVLEQWSTYHRPASYGDTLQVHTQIAQWGTKSFKTTYRLMRGEDLIAEGWDKRAFVRRHPDDPVRIQAVPVPEDIKALCS